MGATKALPKHLAEHVAAELEKHLASAKFVRADGQPMSQRQKAKKMGIAQPVVSAVLSLVDKDRQGKRDASLGINTVLKLREAMKMPLDDLLGLEPVAPRDASMADVRHLVDASERLLEALWGMGWSPSTSSEAGRLIAETIRAIEKVTGQKFSHRPRKRGAA